MAFARQVLALCRKNAIVLGRHWFINLMRCFVLLIGFGIFLGIAQLFLIKPSNLGMGTIEPVKAFSKAFDPAFRLVWADASNGTASPAAADIMDRVTRDFTDAQRRQVIRVDDANAVAQRCPQNFQLYSECFAALIFTSPNATSPTDITYTLRGDAGFFFVDVVRHTSDFEKRVLPLQVAVDHAIIELAGGLSEPLPLPLTLPFTQETNEEQDLRIRLSFVRGFRSLLVLAFFACFLGIVYHLAGSAQSERALGITAHMKVMGLRDSARVISWHVSLSAAYLPAWIITALIWRYRIFAATNVGLMIIIHLITGLSLASWTLFASVPFGRSPQLAAVVATFLALLIAILALVAGHIGSGGATLFTLILPPAFFIFATRGLAGWENHQLVANVIKADPDRGIRLLPLIVVGLINIVLFPALAVWWERRLYDAREPNRRSWAFWRRNAKPEGATAVGEVDKSMAISIRNLRKVYPGNVVAVNDLSFDVPRGSLFVLLGSNGAGKSTSLSIIAGLLGRTSGSVWRADAEGGAHGRIGIVPQKNVMHPELTCLQTVQLWSAIKSDGSRARETSAELRDLLKECDLEAKIDSNCDAMSGGQKRKLQLAIGLVGGSTTVLVDECTSGVDPLSRRAIWRTLNRVRGDVTIVYTTHFLDEGDLLGDHVAILAAPGKLVASDHPVNLKAKMGGDYTAHVTFDAADHNAISRHEHDLMAALKSICPDVTTTSSATAHVGFRLGTRDGQLVSQVLNLFESTGRREHSVRSYDVVGPTLEDVFLNLMLAEEQTRTTSPSAEDEKVTTPAVSEKPDSPTPSLHAAMDGQCVDRTPAPLDLTTGKRISVVRQSLVVVYKRFLVVRRSWLTPLLAVLVGVCGCCIPLFFLENQAKQCGVREVREERINSTTFRAVRLWLPDSNIGYGHPFFPDLQAIIAPPTLPAELGTSLRLVSVNALPDTGSAIQFVKDNYKNVSFGALAFDGDSADAQVTFVWEATAGTSGATLNNLASNILLNRVRPEDDIRLIKAQYAPFTGLGGGPLNSLKWMAFFSAALSVVPAFATLYTARERKANVQAMQRSNGLTNPAALWLGHVLFDAIPGIAIATVVTLVFAFAVDQFHGVGYLWVVLALYSFTGSLFAYCFVQLTSSPLAAFAACAGYQIVMFVLYLASYLLIYTYAKNSKAPDLITITHYTLSLLSPIAPVLRAALVSINLFNLLCSGNGVLESGSLGTIDKFGSPIVYLIGLAALYFFILVAVDSNFRLTFRRRGARPNSADSDADVPDDVLKEANETAANTEAPLRVLHATKSFSPGLPPQVDDVSFSVGANVVFALLGPNGAGKSTTFNIIRGEVVQDYGEVYVKDLGVCPQFSALDSLTVREHLQVYGLLKGIPRGPLLKRNVDIIIRAATLLPYADRLASQLSGGNARKLALAIALMGSPPVILVDEFSTGIDPATKRTMWETLRRVTAGKAVVITTHSMEEAAALSTKVGIIARKMLAVGTTESLEARYPIYDVHVACRTREDVQRANEVFSNIPGASQAEDVATRFEVPVGSGDGSMSLARLFELLSRYGGAGLEYAVERTSLETVFLKVIRANRVQEEDIARKRSPFAWLKRRA